MFCQDNIPQVSILIGRACVGQGSRFSGDTKGQIGVHNLPSNLAGTTHNGWRVTSRPPKGQRGGGSEPSMLRPPCPTYVHYSKGVVTPAARLVISCCLLQLIMNCRFLNFCYSLYHMYLNVDSEICQCVSCYREHSRNEPFVWLFKSFCY